MMMKVPLNASHTAMDSPGLFYSLDYFGGQNQEDLGFGLLVESETRRILQQGSHRPPTYNSLNLADAACNRDQIDAYLCTPSENKGVKRSENCGGDMYNRLCHRQPR
ncbi:hypothetical protein V6N13_147137 [Hibiscus sabdariffa]|uniref:Uncharacterized protein n=1 Tax=Hibiscus sabdariffa TaxID=183260 RepID=A0ABR2TUK0_9ROSI